MAFCASSAPGDGIEYDGSWKQEMYHGAGVMVNRNSWKYTGEQLKGHRTFFGRFDPARHHQNLQVCTLTGS